MLRIAIIFVVLALFGCNETPVSEGDELPQDLAGLKELKGRKKVELKQLKRSLAEIDEQIKSLDTSFVRPKRLITTIAVTRKDFKRFARVPGTVQSRDLVSVSSETGGRISSVTVIEGESVRRGQLIARIDLESLRKQRSELEKSLELAQDLYTRQSRLWEQNIGSEVQFLQAKNNVERLEKSIETIDYQLTKEYLYAPLSGVVDMVNLKAGETAGPATPIVMILDTRNIKVVADVPENFLGKVKKGDAVEIRFPALEDELRARVTLIGRKIDPANRTFKIEINIPYNQGLYKPNLLAEVLINDYLEPDVLVISQELIQQEIGGKAFVMVAEETPDGPRAKKIYVHTGESFEGEVVVTSGLTGDEQLVFDGARGLKDQEYISIVDEEPTIDDR